MKLELAGVLGLQEPFQKVQVHVVNDTVETFQSVPLKIEIESVDGQFSKEISMKTCPQKVTGNYRVVNWTEHQNKWPHLTQCTFAKPANNGLVDLLVGIDNAELHYSHVDLRGKSGGPIARLGPLGWSCIGAPENEAARTRSHVIRALFSKEPIWSNGRESCCDVNNSLQRFWEIEKSGTECTDRLVLTEEERLALNKVKDSRKYKKGRYRVAVPWKDEKPELPNTKPMDPSEWSKRLVPNRPSEMPEMKTSKRKEETNAFAALVTYSLQKDAAPKHNNICEVWRLEPKRFPSWKRLVRVHARVRRVLHNLRSRDDRKAGIELSHEEIKDAEGEIVSLAQCEAFIDEYAALTLGKLISQESQLIKLNPCIDEDGVIRCDGRLKFAEFLPYDTRCPIILPRRHWVTKLIVKNYHERVNHAAGINFILCQLSERFWIIAGREEIREWDHECNQCKKRRNRPACQNMAPLPKTRLRFTFWPFAQTAVDFSGPLYSVQGRRKPR